jgi:transforming growth factor-beta-induced protein
MLRTHIELAAGCRLNEKGDCIMRCHLVLTGLLAGTLFALGCGQPPAPSTPSETGEVEPASEDVVTEEPAKPAEPAESAEPPAPADIVDTAVAAGGFKTLVAAVQAAELVETLKGAGPFTVFAPTDEAFAKLPAGTLDDLLKPENKDTLTAILTYHVVPGKVMAADVVKLKSATTAQGGDVTITVEGDAVKVNDANVTATDIECANGVIHVIDAVILPPAAEPTPKPTPEPAAKTEAKPAATEEAKDIVDTAVAADGFKTLVAAVQAAGLVETLKGAGPFTVFAPTDEAFSKLPAGTLDDLLKPENKDQLTAILTYHVVPGKVMAADVVKLKSATTAQGGDVTITVEGDAVKVNDANVTATDIECANGVIHVIDAVILPPDA